MSKEINMQAFCGEQSKYQLDKPFVQNGLKAATDGRLLVVIPVNETDTPAGKKPFPTIKTLFRDYNWKKERFSIKTPERSTKDNIRCDDCYGDGKVHQDCAECGGEGVCNKCVCGYEHDCGKCGGDGYAHTGPRCSQCGGTGKGYDNQKIGSARFMGKYIAKIATLLPNPSVEKIGRKRDGSSPCMRFVFDGGYGYLMALAD